MPDKHSITRADGDSPLIRRQILICLLQLLLRPKADLHPEASKAKQSRERGTVSVRPKIFSFECDPVYFYAPLRF